MINIFRRNMVHRVGTADNVTKSRPPVWTMSGRISGAVVEKEAVEGHWFRSARCDSGNCVEAARTSSGYSLRNSTYPLTTITFDHVAWKAFTDDIRAGRFDAR